MRRRIRLVNCFRPSKLDGRRVFIVLILLGGLSAGRAGDVYVSRLLPATCVSSVSNYVTQLTVTVSNGTPSAFIVTEVLPVGWRIVAATWNGSSYLPTIDGLTNKWVFGVQPAAGPGTLSYTTTPTNAFERQYSISGKVKYLDGANQIDRITIGNSLLSSCDRDNDGMPDDWEIHYGLNPTNAADALQDSDGDGMSNLQEYLADTNPTNSNSYLHITKIQPVAGGIAIIWQGGILSTQYLQQRIDLTGTSSWVDIFTNLPPTANPSGFTNYGITNNTGFYRIRVTR